ncbi:hypothetical protein Tco_1003613 [Tanacetum coccineum]|uniref:Uncharacterized protein n=1 Tax=Tanacetum coccineum TaxID=301880 RepID=A0ABQ5F9X2_9ASTR
METVASESLGLGYRALRRQELTVEEDQVHNTFEVGQGYGSVPEPERPERVSALRQPTLTTWIDLEDGRTYIEVPTYPPLAPPIQTPLFPEWSSSSLPVSLVPSIIPSPISSPIISLTIPSPIASPVATPTATILVDEDQFIEIGAYCILGQERLGMRSSPRDIDLEPRARAGEDCRDVWNFMETCAGIGGMGGMC